MSSDLHTPAPLAGTVCLVTGGGRGIGRSSALAFARAGAAVAVAARSRDEVDAVVAEIRAAGALALGLVADVTKGGECHDMVAQAVAQLGRLDVLLCNAGGGLTAGSLAAADPDEWAATIALNLTSVFHCAQAAIPVMAAQGAGKILVTGSGAGHSAGPRTSAYSAAKAGVSHLVKCLAQEVWSDGIDVNEIVPGPVATELTKHTFVEGQPAMGSPSERVKGPDEVAELALWLAARPPAGPTGQTFSLARRPI